MVFPWQRDTTNSEMDSDSCAAPSTVTVTRTVLQGVATSTVDPDSSSFPTITDGMIVSTIPVFGGGFETTLAPAPSSLPTTTASITSVTVSKSVATTKTLSLASASHSASSSKTPCPTAGSAPSKSAPAGTVAGGVLGGVAGLAMIMLLLLWCCRRKRKVNITLKRNTKNITQPESPKDVEAVNQDRDLALRALEQNQHVPSPRSFDFGLPKIPPHSTAIMQKPWI
ncbi:hypothetical protein LTS07_005783 [Exophiala sideris]|uniref:Mid2 domain-containing protein n=1 Tax=Exophiala sideris TaxID=1016849 RepID=A0ABR0J6R3_9EURO|nr:hypothetical protein LTS07_005783 [Exophiala sideris]KAK5036985.1 hypothetical protein LTR13_005365 [Exophiala sideris]KAK5057951.1 hypothetical protein LTR69_006948 [Exophiala sideris]KAK5181910.1 hypothetical protein LTR44_005511 [Eurotiomycetes sp. CCFEE 6388]